MSKRGFFGFWTAALGLSVGAALLGGAFSSPAAAAGLNGDEAYSEGPQVCSECHAEAVDNWLSHGHSRKLGIGGPALKPLDGKFGLHGDARSGGFLLPRHDEDVYNWDNVLFTIGSSKHWKTHFVGADGHILTKNGKNQYNWSDGSWSNYHKDEKRAFTCGTCHTTGYNKEGKAFANGFPGGPKQPTPGVKGDWAAFNVTCEACHGPAAEHVAAPSKENIEVDASAELCGNCHIRGEPRETAQASKGFIKHHEQYPEMQTGAHKDLECTTCHDSHVTRASGIKVAKGNKEVCDTCHAEQREKYTGSSMQKAGVKCQDCHMARATKSAIKNGPYEGDVWSHLFKIDTGADYSMFAKDAKKKVIAKGALSLEYACFRCHADASKEAYSKIKGYHTLGKK